MLAEFDSTGGTRTYAKQLVDFYTRNNYELTMLSKGPDNDVDMATYVQSRGGRLLLHEHGPICNFSFFAKLLSLRRERELVDKIVKNYCPDIIVASVGTPGQFFGYMGNGRRSFYILHTYPQLSRNVFRCLLEKLVWAVLVPADVRFITVSEFSRKCMVSAWGLWRKRSDFLCIYSTTGDPVTAQHLSRQEHINVLTVGHVVSYKDPLLWIEVAACAVEKIPKLKFIWVGPGPLLEPCMNRIATLGLQEKIFFTGPSTDVDSYYQMCDIYLQTSRIESLSLSVLDAMRYGKPSVVTNVGGLPELVCNGETGWVVDVGNKYALARCIVRLAENASQRKRMGGNAQTTYTSHFSPEKWNDQMRLIHEGL